MRVLQTSALNSGSAFTRETFVAEDGYIMGVAAISPRLETLAGISISAGCRKTPPGTDILR